MAAPMVLVATRDDAVPKLRFGEKPVKMAPAVEDLVGYRWPLAHPRLTLPFGPTVWGSRAGRRPAFHDGVTSPRSAAIGSSPRTTGTVLAAGRKYDACMGWIGDLGPYHNRLDQNHLWRTLPIVVVIDDGNGYRSIYAHFCQVIGEDRARR